MSTAFPVFGSDGKQEGEMDQEYRCGLPVYRPRFVGDDAAQADEQWFELMFKVHPESAVAFRNLERCRATVRHYAALADEVAGRVLAAQNTARLADSSLLHEEILRPQRFGDPPLQPGPHNRLNALLEEQRELREELCAACEELDQAEQVYKAALERSGQLAGIPA